MNRIAAVWQPGAYQPRHHWLLTLDDVPLDRWLDQQKLSEHHYQGLVPALGNLARSDEATLAWQRILPLSGCRAVAPLLVCPEHQDFSCLVVMAEVSHEADCISWLRFGINYASAATPEDLEECVQWLDGPEPLRFDKHEYRACLARFHLLRLNQKLGLSGKTLNLKLTGSPLSASANLSGQLKLGPEGLMLESPQGTLPLRDEWLPLMGPGSGADSDFELVLQSELLPAGLLQALEKFEFNLKIV